MLSDIEVPVEAGNQALDFLNTAHLSRGHSVDLLQGPAELVGWLARADLLHDERLRAWLSSPAARRMLLTEARRLRAEIGGLVEAFRLRRRLPEGSVYGVNRVLDAGRTSWTLTEDERGPVLQPLERGEPPLALLAPIAWAAARLLIDIDPPRVRRCSSSRCRAWFLDTSRGGQRRWCSMERCGNRAKAAKHRSRLSAGR